MVGSKEDIQEGLGVLYPYIDKSSRFTINGRLKHTTEKYIFFGVKTESIAVETILSLQKNNLSKIGTKKTLML
jgi:hypothetical protein